MKRNAIVERAKELLGIAAAREVQPRPCWQAGGGYSPGETALETKDKRRVGLVIDWRWTCPIKLADTRLGLRQTCTNCLFRILSLTTVISSSTGLESTLYHCAFTCSALDHHHVDRVTRNSASVPRLAA
jgi:hypothetical protein